jgi:poly(3-hydroxybutyrate) depolymerase
MRRTTTLIATICLLVAACGGDGAVTTAPAPAATVPVTVETTTTTTTAPLDPELAPGTVLRLEFGPESAPIEYYAYLPDGYDGAADLPLIIGLHGYTQSPSSTLGAFPLSLLDERGYAWVAPGATEKEGRNRQWAFITTEAQSMAEWPENPPGGGQYHPYGDEDVDRIVEVLDDFSEDVYHPADWTRDGAHLWAEFQGCSTPLVTEIVSGEFVLEESRYMGCRDGSEIVILLVDGGIPGIWFNTESPWADDLDPPFNDPPSVFLDFFEAHTM